MSRRHWRNVMVLTAAAAAAAFPAAAADKTSGTLVVGGKTIRLTHGFAVAKTGFFDPKKDDIEVVLCDAAVPVGSVEAKFQRMALSDKGQVHCVENTINASGQVINFTLQHDAFKIPESGGSTDMVYEPGAKAAGRITGRIRSTKPQASFEKVPYTYDATFDLAVPTKKN